MPTNCSTTKWSTQTGADIGAVHSFWANAHSDQLEFLGVKTGWLFGHNHVIPVDKVELDEATRTVRVPYAGEFLKGAPNIDANATISDEEEADIYRYYKTGSSGTATSTERTSLGNTATSAGTTMKNTAEAAGAALGLGSTASQTTGTASTDRATDGHG